MPGVFVTFEGPDGSGKSTQVQLLRDALAGREAVFVREPGGTDLGERIRALLLHSRLEMAPEAEMHLYMAARAQLLRLVIEPALRAGRIVVADRYHDSTLAYQGGGRGADASWPRTFPKPDLTFLLELPAEAARGRIEGPDRLESEPLDFHRRVAMAYERLAADEPGRFVRLDALLSAGHLHELVTSRLTELIEGAAASS